MRRREDGKIFLIDFGAVKELGSLMVNSRGEIASSVIIGTPGYMPSEQGLGKPCLASDVYAVGMSAISALTGLQPFELEENPQTGEVIWLQQAQVSQHLGEMITKMVRRHHSLRYPSATNALQALTSQMQSIPLIPSTQLNPPIPSPTPVPTPQPTTPKPQSQTTPTPTSVSKPPEPKPPQQKIPQSSINISSTINWKRRKFIRTMGLVGGGCIAAISGQRILQGNFNEGSGIDTSKLKSFDFETVTVDASGNIINRQPLNAKYFTEDLGNGVTLEMVEIPGGEFFMGSPSDEKQREDNESPQHKVTIKPFFMGKFAVTQAQYQAIMGTNPSELKGEKLPVELVSWNDATEFCKKLIKKTGRTYRLPSEAEWEYACRAGTTTPFHFGETITTDIANYNSDVTYADAPKGKYRNKATDVGSFPPNAFGLYDMHGNVSEWCQDTWHDNYNGAPTDGSAWIDWIDRIRIKAFRPVLRGGRWYESPANCRSAYRDDYQYPDNAFNSYGLRVVCGVFSKTPN